jgi:hypothetical protein
MTMTRTFRSLFTVVVIATLFSPLFAGATASAATVPECAYATITVSVGATYRGAGVASTTRLVPVYFKNHGVTCHLPLTGPAVVAFRDQKLSRTHTVTQDARPAAWTGQKYVVLAASARDEALFEIAALSSAAMKSRACGEQTANGFLVEGFGQPVAKWIYFARSLPGVCFYSGVGPSTTNVKMTWVGPK